MKGLMLLSAILAVAAASYPAVQTWSLSQLTLATDSLAYPNHALLPCLLFALEPVMMGAMMQETVGPDPEQVGAFKIPAPSGKNNWTGLELTNAANIIASKMDDKKKSPIHDPANTFWTSEELETLMDLFPLPDKPELTEERRTLEIYMCILDRLYQATAIDKDFDLTKNTTEVLFPAIDISIWNATELNEAADTPYNNQRLRLYLNMARVNPMMAFDDSDGKKVCVVSPVGVIPQADPHYYLPKAIRKLIQMSRESRRSMRDMLRRSYHIISRYGGRFL